jgi:hypothetical protein
MMRAMTFSTSCAPICASRPRRHAALPRTAQGRRHLPHDQIDPRHQTNLSPDRRGHSRPRVLQLLALVLRKALDDHLVATRIKPEWGALIRELDRLQEIETEQDGKRFLLRTPVTGDVGRVFKAVGIALPPNIREVAAPEPIGT